jgi:hypothetical protein
MTRLRFARNRDVESKKRQALKKIEARGVGTQNSASASAGVVQTAAKRLSCVLGMLSSFGGESPPPNLMEVKG